LPITLVEKEREELNGTLYSSSMRASTRASPRCSIRHIYKYKDTRACKLFFSTEVCIPIL